MTKSSQLWLIGSRETNGRMDWLKTKLPGGSYKYTALQEQSSTGDERARVAANTTGRNRTIMKVAFGSLLIAVALYFVGMYM